MSPARLTAIIGIGVLVVAGVLVLRAISYIVEKVGDL